MATWVRVKDKATGHEFSAIYADPALVDVLDKPAVDERTSRPLPAKPKMPARPAGSDSPEEGPA